MLDESCACAYSTVLHDPVTKPHLSIILLVYLFMIFFTAINVIVTCLILGAALEIRSLHAQTQGRSQKIARQKARRQARKYAQKARRWYTDVSTQTIQVPSSPNGRRFLPVMPIRRSARSQISRPFDSRVNDTSRTAGASSSTDHYPESTSSSCSSALQYSHPSYAGIGALDAGNSLLSVSQFSSLSGTTLAEMASSDSEQERSRSTGFCQRFEGGT